MDSRDSLERASLLMNGFALRTGLMGSAPPRRYLWTDAFAVCNWLGLYEATGEKGYLGLALRLVDQVHQVLGRNREDGSWLSGLSEADGARLPTVKGLRIGKPLPERPESQKHDDGLEWDRDGQYFHYLTRWIHALVRVYETTGEAKYVQWADQLYGVAHDAFLDESGTRMVWKRSVDLKRVLVPSMGQHDPLDGHMMGRELEHRLGVEFSHGSALVRFTRLFDQSELFTADPLSVGCLWIDSLALTRLGDFARAERLTEAAWDGVEAWLETSPFQRSLSHRVAFRELGLLIGLKAAGFTPRLAHAIEMTWADPDVADNERWREYRDINEVMLATALWPNGWVGEGERAPDRMLPAQ
jgi:hypothetical protein